MTRRDGKAVHRDAVVQRCAGVGIERRRSYRYLVPRGGDHASVPCGDIPDSPGIRGVGARDAEDAHGLALHGERIRVAHGAVVSPPE